MKLKQIPEDFKVTENSNLSFDENGPYSVYALYKRNASTFEAVETLICRFNLLYKDISYSGLKDRTACTRQYVSIYNGEQKTSRGKFYRLKYLGRMARQLNVSDIVSNGFDITIRDLEAGQTGELRKNMEAIKLSGVPNYFDEQRFGSVRHNKGFVFEELMKGNYENALRLAIATPTVFDRSRRRWIKSGINENWGNWEGILANLPGFCPERSIIKHLVKEPGDFINALNKYYRAELKMILSIYPSMLWNEMIAEYVRKKYRKILTVPYSVGNFIFPADFAQGGSIEELSRLRVPMPNKDAVYEGDMKKIAEKVFCAHNITQDMLELKDTDKFRLKGTRRRVFFFPEDVTMSEPEADEINGGRLKMKVTFRIPSGCYATMLIKRIAGEAPVEDNILRANEIKNQGD